MENQTTLPIDYNGKLINEQAVIDVLTAELPQTARILNADAICVEHLYGPDSTSDEVDIPENVYEAFDAILESMENEGLAQSGEWCGIRAYGLTKAGFAKAGF